MRRTASECALRESPLHTPSPSFLSRKPFRLNTSRARAYSARMTRQTNLIVIHCSASPNGVSLFTGKLGEARFTTPAQEIDKWHAARGFKRNPNWSDVQEPTLKHIGYHFVVYTAGAVLACRHLGEVGAHAQGYNSNSIGICMIGTDAYSPEQWACLKSLIEGLKKDYPHARICGHRDLSPDADNDGVVEPHEWLKTCPGFAVAKWLAGGLQPLAGHIYPLPPGEGGRRPGEGTNGRET